MYRAISVLFECILGEGRCQITYCSTGHLRLLFSLTSCCRSSGSASCEEGCKKAGESVAAAEEENDAARRISPICSSQTQRWTAAQ